MPPSMASAPVVIRIDVLGGQPRCSRICNERHSGDSETGHLGENPGLFDNKSETAYERLETQLLMDQSLLISGPLSI